MDLTALYVSKRIIIYWHILHSSGLTSNVDSIVGIPHKIYSMQRILIHIKPISLLNVPIFTQGMQRTWWPEDMLNHNILGQDSRANIIAADAVAVDPYILVANSFLIEYKNLLMLHSQCNGCR